MLDLGPKMSPAAEPPHQATPAWRWLAVALLVLGYVALVSRGLGFFAWHDDEGVFALTAKALYDGQALYRDVWFNYPPGYAQYLALLYRLFGYSLTVARVGSLLAGLLTLGAVGLMARRVWGAGAALGAMLLLATVPHFVVVSSAALAEVPALGLATLGVALAVIYLQRGRWPWLVGSGLALALALLIKPTVWPALAAPALAIVWVARRPGPIIRQGLLFAAAVAVPLAGDVLLHEPALFVHQLWVTYHQSREAFPLALGENARSLAEYLFADKYGLSHVSLLALAGLGLAASWRERRGEAWLLSSWLVLCLVSLLTHTPLYRHHQVLLLPPLAVLAGGGLGVAARALRHGGIGWRQLGSGLLLAWLLVELRGGAWAALATVQTAEADALDVSQQAVTYLAAHTEPGDLVLTDAPILAIHAERAVPIEAINTSRMRLYTHELTDQQLIDLARQQAPAAIVFWEKKLDSADDFASWVACQYDQAVAYDERHRIYTPRTPSPLPASLQRLDQPFAEADGAEPIVLLGYAWQNEAVAAGESLALTLYWQATGRPASDYKVFVHVLDRDGALIAQEDARPRQWLCPTYVWQPGERIDDPHTIAITTLGAGGPYTVQIGLYDGYTGARLRPDHLDIAVGARSAAREE
ncbi:MAG: glycosyltransferase family 39 protein [Anaerolineales bacterium]